MLCVVLFRIEASVVTVRGVPVELHNDRCASQVK